MGKEAKGTGPTGGKEKIKFGSELVEREEPVRPPGGAVQRAAAGRRREQRQDWAACRGHPLRLDV